MFGLLNIDKPAGLTSRDVVNRVQRLVRPIKVGHAGTLDPLATGVLVLCVGPATRLIQYVQQLPKRYTATFLLGRRSVTDDIEAEVEEIVAPQPSHAQIAAALPRFIGTIQQRPPAYSAVKVQGRRAYELARKGKQVELRPRPVVIHSLEIKRFNYPELVLDIRCGSGTYVRSLGRDLAESLGTAAVMSALIRTEIGHFQLTEAARIDQLDESSLAAHLLPPQTAVAHLPSLTVNESELSKLASGIMLDRRADSPPEDLAAFDTRGQLVAILTPHRNHQLRPLINFAPAILSQRDH